MSIPYDILDAIASYWSGRYLRQTCRQLARNMNLESYLLVETVEIENHWGTSGLMVTTSKLSDGRFHGASTLQMRGADSKEICTYKFGNISTAELISQDGLIQLDTLVDGYWCSWSIGDRAYIRGDDFRILKMAQNISLAQFMKMASGWVKRNRPHSGPHTSLHVRSENYNSLLPHICCY